MSGQTNLVDGLTSVPYVCHPNHRLLNCDIISEAGGNIGRNGENLTITFLSMNRSVLSERLLLSLHDVLPGYRGKVLVVDNGSDVEELEKLNAVIAKLDFSVKVVELGKNYGVSGGRNRTIPFVETDWVMFLDNDIYFSKNPLPRIQSDIELLGCHFISLPLLDADGETLFANGGNIYVSFDSEHVDVGAGSICRQEKVTNFDGPGFLSTFLFGGACVLKKQSFLNVGGYDEAMFVGFEDIDFSIRLFREGFKVGTTGVIALIHDHPKPVSVGDVAYERTRFTRQVLHQSASYLERKHGYRFWSTGVEFWLQDKHRSLGPSLGGGEIEESSTSLPRVVQLRNLAKPKVALIIDSDSWAFANIARQISKKLKHRFDFQIIPTEVVEDVNRILMMTSDCSVVHFFWREYLNLVTKEFSRENSRLIGIDPAIFFDKYVRKRTITTSVYDHLFLSDDEINARVPLFNELVKGYTVSSQRLMDLYRRIDVYPNPSQLTEDGVDLDLFRPMNTKRFNSFGQRTMVVGWAGNSAWAGELGEDFKGFHTILKPAVEQLQQEGLKIRFELADRQRGFIAHERMPEYYSTLDLYVCPSKIEGTPNPVLESMACGVPVVSTDVGVVPQLVDDDPFDMILPCRSIDILKERIRDIYHKSPTEMKAMSDYEIEKIKSWGWDRKCRNFEKFFERFV